MGYYTDYTLSVRKIKDVEQYNQLVGKMKEKELIGYAFNSGIYDEKRHEATFETYDSVKWYDHAEDMTMLADKFPNMYFELDGVGEDFGDYWREYYHDMDVECCRGEIVYEQPRKVKWTELMPL